MTHTKMFNRILLWGFCLLGVPYVSAQTRTSGDFAREFSFTTDNDAFLFAQNDAYYTNGFFFALKTAKEHKGKRVIKAWELGQMIYTPLKRVTTGPADIDRPYCGYLFLKFSETMFPGKASVLQFNGGIGEVGAASGGEDVQDSYHKLLNYARFTGWQYQVQNALGIDVGATYSHTLLEDSSWVKLVPTMQANLGMNFTNAKLGAWLCLGSFERNANSALWDARVQRTDVETRRKYELFLFWHPELILQGYNSTAQGGLLSKSSGTAALRDIEPVMFQQAIGVCYAEGRWTTQLAIIHQSKEVTTQTRPQDYGSIRVSYRFH